jgi:hypothetical protein
MDVRVPQHPSRLTGPVSRAWHKELPKQVIYLVRSALSQTLKPRGYGGPRDLLSPLQLRYQWLPAIWQARGFMDGSRVVPLSHHHHASGSLSLPRYKSCHPRQLPPSSHLHPTPSLLEQFPTYSLDFNYDSLQFTATMVTWDADKDRIASTFLRPTCHLLTTTIDTHGHLQVSRDQEQQAIARIPR